MKKGYILLFGASLAFAAVAWPFDHIGTWCGLGMAPAFLSMGWFFGREERRVDAMRSQFRLPPIERGNWL